MARGQTISVDVRMLFLMHSEGRTREEICTALGIRLGSWWAVTRRYRLPPRVPKPGQVADKTLSVDPTHDEIEERCAAIQASWTPLERERRIVGPKAKRVEAPYYTFGMQEASFSQATPLRYLTSE